MASKEQGICDKPVHVDVLQAGWAATSALEFGDDKMKSRAAEFYDEMRGR